ncbi:hypothetical protein J2X31_001174 [Flavobacterium arsenatis]|uniref:Uncharacterized protein n=1 Tax=Flavobacterium arsenatis TaxID=1484332 RepID=A0ABU1TMX2_9FLAO|nr:hypothetical protein [Flavobacterium arsenatis]MDR6967167.1 hypothetical protein [Flavobacterium arsenatis]
MESIIFVGSLLLISFLVYLFFFRNNKELDKKSYYLKRFLRNKEQSLKHINQVEALVVENNGSKQAFPDKDMTFFEYLESLKSKYENDYSEITHQILRKNRLSHAQKQEYTKKLLQQSEDLYLMEVDLGILKKTWKNSVS